MIIERRDIGDVLFNTLDEGAIFIHNDIPYMKIQEVDEYDAVVEVSNILNAVCLGNGTLEHFDDDECVYARPDSDVIIQ